MQIRERAAGVALRDHVLHSRQADIAHCAEGVAHRPPLHREIGVGGVKVRRRDRRLKTAGLVHEARQLVCVVDVQTHGGGQKRDRIIGF